jgi:thioredoxin reductase
MTTTNLPVAIVGAGPVGLAAAVHLLARGETPILFEAGDAVAHSIRQWGHVHVFTPWRYCVDKATLELLTAAGWTHPDPEDVPTGSELVEQYLEPLAALPALSPHIHLNTRVTGVTRRNTDKVRTVGRQHMPFVLRVVGNDGVARSIEARAVIDASGTWTQPNPAGSDGLPAIGEVEASDHVATGIPDVLGRERARYADKTVAVIGSGHSALNAINDLAVLRETAPGTRILWVVRKQQVDAAFGGEAADALPERGALGVRGRELVEKRIVEVFAPFRIAAIARDGDGRLIVSGDHIGAAGEFKADELIVVTGFRPDLSMLREVRLSLDPWLESAAGIGELIDPNLHSCGTVRPHGTKELAHPEPNFWIAGMKSYGRAPTFLLATGYEQVRSIAAALAGDHEAAARVELELPETGVCNSTPKPKAGAKAPSSCCGPAQPVSIEPTASCCGG